MKKVAILMISSLLGLCGINTHYAHALPAFPGAEGFGAVATGGRGGQVVFVDNLNSSGPGSLRAACEMSVPRIIIFRVGGLIQIDGYLKIKPDATVAGQTAPGDGVCLRGATVALSNNIIFRGIRVRTGDKGGVRPENRDCISIGDNTIVDHCSASWSIDENISTYGKHNTLQWTIIGEALYNSLHPKGPHPKGMLIDNAITTVHNCLFAYNGARAPHIGGNVTVEFVNNVIWHGGTAYVTANYDHDKPNFVNLINNHFGVNKYALYLNPYKSSGGIGPGSKIYVKGNISKTRPIDKGDEWLAVWANRYESARVNSPAVPYNRCNYPACC